jgi:uncharacterized protein (TIGR04141 family)
MRRTRPWVDKVREIRDGCVTGKLDADLLDRLKKRDVERIWLAPSEILNWREAPRFRYRGFHDRSVFDDIFMAEFSIDLSRRRSSDSRRSE